MDQQQQQLPPVVALKPEDYNTVNESTYKAEEIPLRPNMRLVDSKGTIRQPRKAINNPALFAHCLPFFLTHVAVGDDYTFFLKGVINNPHNPDRATNVGIVVHDVESSFYVQFKSPHMNPTVYPQRIEAYLAWLERHCLAYSLFHVPMGGDITKVQSQYNPLHSDSYANQRKNKNKKLSATVQSPEDLQLFTKWEDASGLYKTIYGWTPGPMDNVIRVYTKRAQVISTIARFVESQEYCSAVAKLYPYYMVRTFESRQLSPEQQFCLDRGLCIGQFCHIYFENGNIQPVTNDEELEFYADLEFRVDESQVFPFPSKEILPTPPTPNFHVMSFDIETNNRTTINPFTGTKQTRFSKAIWQPKDIAKYLKDQLYQFESMEKNRLANEGRNDSMYKELVALRDEYKNAIVNMCKQLKNYKPWENMMGWYETACACYGHIKYLDIPNPLDVDEILVLVAVLSVYGKPRNKPLEFPEAVAFVLEHPNANAPIDRTVLPTKYTALSDEYKRIELRTFDNPMKRTAAFIELIHKWSPTIMTGWNESSFDEPYIWNNNVFHATYNKNNKDYKYQEHGRWTEFGKPNFGLLRKAKKSTFVEGRMFTKNVFDIGDEDDDESEAETPAEDDDNDDGDDEVNFQVDEEGSRTKAKKKGNGKKKTDNKNPSRISAAMKAHVTLPMITPMDGLAVWQNPSFGVKSIFESKGTTPQFSLDNVSSIELKYPSTNIDLPRRKLQVSHSETPGIWKQGGSAMWFFICYCYVDATLPLFLVEKHAKIQLLFALASKCNCSLDLIYNNGMQAKISAFFFASARTYEGGSYLVPEWGLRALHWPDVWLHENPYIRAFSFCYMRPRPPGTKGYMGALVKDPSRLLHFDPIATKDYASLYPSTASAYHFDYDKFLTEFMIEYYKLPSNMMVTQILGPKKIIFCGDICQSEVNQVYDHYNTPMLKKANWVVKDGGFINYMILQLMSMRNVAKANMAKMIYYNKIVTVPQRKWPPPAASAGTWNREKLARPVLRGKLGKWYDAFYKAAESLETWTAEFSKIKQELLSLAPPGIDDLDYISTTQMRVYDAEQLGLKLILNSIYGFTAPGLSSAILPLMELAASITSEGRRIIRMTGAYCESRRVRKLTELMDKIVNKTISIISPLDFKTKNAKDLIAGSFIVDRFDLSQWQQSESKNEEIFLHDLKLPSPCLIKPTPEALEQVQAFYEQHHLPDHLQLHGGDTDSVMIGYPRAFVLKKDDPEKEDYPLVQRMANLNVTMISSFLHGVMNLTQEKTSKASLMVDPKNYFMSVLEAKELLCKGVEIVRGDTFALCNRLIGYAAKELIHKSTYTTFKDTFKRVFSYIQSELMKVAKGKVTISEFIKHKKLAKVIYKNIPEHVIVAQKQGTRGHPVEPGDFIVYTYADIINPEDEKLRWKRFDRDNVITYIDKKGGAIAEDVGYLIETDGRLDVEHVMKLIIPMFVKFFRHIVAPAQYPPIDETASNTEQARVASLRAEIREKQNQTVYDLLFKRIDDILKQRLGLRMLSILKMNTLMNMYLKNNDKECQNCNVIFTTVNKLQDYCPACLENSRDIQHELEHTLTKNKTEVAATLETCRNCIEYTGFSMDVESCTKYDCEVFEKRSILKINIQQTERNLKKIKEVIGNHIDTNTSSATKKQKHEHITIEFGA